MAQGKLASLRDSPCAASPAYRRLPSKWQSTPPTVSDAYDGNKFAQAWKTIHLTWLSNLRRRFNEASFRASRRRGIVLTLRTAASTQHVAYSPRCNAARTMMPKRSPLGVSEAACPHSRLGVHERIFVDQISRQASVAVSASATFLPWLRAMNEQSRNAQSKATTMICATGQGLTRGSSHHASNTNLLHSSMPNACGWGTCCAR